jgi:hypothetical protein
MGILHSGHGKIHGTVEWFLGDQLGWWSPMKELKHSENDMLNNKYQSITER